MISVEHALERILRDLLPLPSEPVPLRDALGRVLAETVRAPFDLPPFANSAMDGFAVLAADTLSAAQGHPVRLQIIGDIPAGAQSLPELKSGQAARITTGAPIPPGGDAVVPVEHTSEAGDMSGTQLGALIDIFEPAAVGAFVRKPGTDVPSGSLAVPAATRLRASELGLLAGLGVETPLVHRQPLAGVLSTGSELVGSNQPIVPGHVRDANGPALAAAVQAAGGRVLPLGIAPDDPLAVASALDHAVGQGVDLLVTSAGVSVGARDYVRMALEQNGTLEFWKVNMRPGKPLAWGHFRDVPFFGLPGNPVSAQVGFELFVRPALRRLSGCSTVFGGRLPVRMLQPVDSDGRESYLRAQVHREGNGFVAELTGEQGSGLSSSMVRANALVILPAGVLRADTGDMLEALPLSDFWEQLA